MAIFKDDNVGDKLAMMRREAEERDAERLANSLGIPYLNTSSTSVQLDALRLIPESEAVAAKIAAIKLEKKEVAVVISDPRNPKTLEAIDKLKNTGLAVAIFICSINSLNKVWEHYKEIIVVAGDITSKIEISETEYNALSLKFTSLSNIEAFFANIANNLSDQSTTNIISYIFGAAISLGASDVHFETAKDGVGLRFRVDGILHTIMVFPGNFYKQIISRIKLLSGLKINIKDSPQDGRFTINMNNSEIEIRVAISPSEFGEAIVMRVLNPNAISLSLKDLGLRGDNEEIAMKQIKRPNGMVLVTGPTGSGKTTTLYAFLKNVTDSESKIITIEDPIEYHLAGIEQTQVNPNAGYTFAAGLKSILRQDPDIILVGEVRDAETAGISVQASLTGHLVFSTLHTNNAIGAIPRLIDLGIKPSLIAPAVSLVIAQRLVRKLCLNCRKEVVISDDLRSKIANLRSKLPQKIKFYSLEDKIYEAVGCDKCNGGYKGRVGIHEFLELDNEYEVLLNKEATEFAIKQIAVKKGFIEMQIDGVLKCLAGVTTFEEVEKTTGSIVW